MKRSTVTAFAVSAFIATAAAACSSSSGDLSTGDDSSPGTDSGSGTDSTVVTNPDGAAPTDSGSNQPSDAGADVKAEPDCTGLAYCENFEGYDDASTILNNEILGPWKAEVSGTVTMKVDGDNPYGGSKALHINIPVLDAGSSTSTLDQSVASGGLVTGNDLWGRVMVWYKNKPNGHTWIFEGQGKSTASNKTMNLNLADQGSNYFLNYHGDTTSGAESSAAGGTPVAGAWVCLQWEYNGSTTTNASEAKVWADGTLIIDSKKAPAQTWDLATPFTSFQLGFVHYPNTTEVIDLYIDDFALNNARVACPL